MPYYGGNQDVDLAAVGNRVAATPTTEDKEFAQQYVIGLDRNPVLTAVGLPIGSISDFADTTLSSVGLTDRQQVNQTFLNAIGIPGVTSWYNENKGAMEVGSGLLGVVVADQVAKRVLAPGSMAMQAIRATPYARRIATLDKQYEQAMRLATLTQRETAVRGAMGVERFIGGEMNLARLGAPALTVTPGRVTQNLFRAAAARGLARNVTTELVMAGTLNTNSFLYADDLAHNVAWSAAGLALGLGIDSAVTGYTLRRLANSEQIRQLNRKAYDPSGFETQRLHAYSVADEVMRAAGVDPKDLGFMFKGSGGLTDAMTSQAIQVQELRKARGTTERAQTLFRNREEVANPMETILFENLNKVTVRGLRGVADSGFSTRLEGLGAPIKESLDRQPTFLMGIEEIGTVPAGMTREATARLREKNLTHRLNAVQELLVANGRIVKKKSTLKGRKIFVDEFVELTDEERLALQDEARELTFMKSQVPVTMLTPGEWVPLSWGKIADEWEPVLPTMEGGLGVDGLAFWTINRGKDNSTRLAIGSNGDVILPRGLKRIEALEPAEMLDLYAAGRAMAKHHIKTQTVFNVPKNANWFVLDVAEQIIKNSGDPSLVKYTDNLTRHQAMVESFAQKVDILKRKQMARTMAKADMFDEEEIFKFRTLFNLPRLTSAQAARLGTSESPLDILLAAFNTSKTADIRKMPYHDILKEFNDANKIVGMTDETVDSLESLQGDSFNLLMDRDGNPIKSIIAYQRPLSPVDFTRDDLLVRHVMRESYLRETLLGGAADDINRELVSLITANPAFSEARKIMELADDQHRSGIPGFRRAAPQSTMGAALNSITSRERRDIDSTVMRAASQVQETKTRAIQYLAKKIFDEHMADSITKINQAPNARSLMLLNQFISFRPGWEVMPKPKEITLPSGEKAYSFVLDHNSRLNQDRFQETFGRALEKGDELLNPDGGVIALDELAMSTLARMQGVHEKTLGMKNTLLKSQNMPTIRSQPWYVPPPDTRNKYVGFTFNQRNEVVPGMTVIADSPEQLEELASELINSKQWKQGYAFRSRQSVEEFMSLWDKAQMDFLAPNTTAIQPNKKNFGRTGGNKLNTQAFNEALITMRDSIMRHGDDVIDILYDPVIKAARARAKEARIETAVGSRAATQHSSIYDRFLQNLTGRSSLSAKDSFFGAPYAWLEQRINGFLASKPIMDAGANTKQAALHAAKTYEALTDFIRAAKPGQSIHGERFDKFAKELGQYMPFKSAAEMLERETKSRTPAEVAAISAKLSWFEAASRLRYFESMHAMVNLSSMVANMPSVIRALQPKIGETIQEAGRRNGMLAMTLNVPGKGDINIPNVMGLIHDSYKDAWRKVPDEFTKKAIRLGYMDQEVAEFQRQWGAIDSKAGWRGFMFGDEGRTGNRLRDKVARSGGLDKWLGILSDKSEAFTRQWGMYAGRRVAKAIGIDDVDAQLNFAHELTNKLIANYDPRNRAEVFQGALGAPIGLFQSYVVNFYQRMFRYVETKDARALATQYATQAAIFGTSSVPGWDTLNWAFFDHDQGKGQDPVESMHARFGKDLGDLLMHGTLSNLPKIINVLPGEQGVDGMSLYTRGDAQFRMPLIPAPEFLGGDGTWNLPVFDTVSRIWNGLGQAASAFMDNTEGVGMNQIAEIMSNVLTNRPLAGMLETFGANGYDTSWDGQVVSESKNLIDAAYRGLGVRSMTQQKEIEMFYQNKRAQEEQAARQDIVRREVRTAIRNGDFEKVPTIFATYVEHGGDPRYYSRFVKESFEAATKTRGERQLEQALNDPNNRSNAIIGRLLDAGIDVDEDENQTDDYGREEQISQIVDQGWQESPDASETLIPE